MQSMMRPLNPSGTCKSRRETAFAWQVSDEMVARLLFSAGGKNHVLAAAVGASALDFGGLDVVHHTFCEPKKGGKCFIK